jgi:hypothetical protein
VFLKIEMKVVVNFVLVLFVLSSCSNSDNSGAIQKLTDTVVVYKHDTINDCLPYVTIAGLYGGKISKGELLHCDGLRLLNNEAGYKIISFKCSNETFKYYADNFQVQNVGALFNDKTLELFNRLEAHATLSIENVRVINKTNDTVMLNSIIVHLPG